MRQRKPPVIARDSNRQPLRVGDIVGGYYGGPPRYVISGLPEFQRPHGRRYVNLRDLMSGEEITYRAACRLSRVDGFIDVWL